MINIHLISAPWAGLKTPSIQVGALKSYLDSIFTNKIKTFSYSAFFSIPTDADSRSTWPNFYIKLDARRELSYFLLFHKNFSFKGNKKPKSNRWILSAINQHMNNPYPDYDKISLEDLNILESITNNYIDNVIVPNLSKEKLNVIGFTLNFNQTHASIYIEKYLLSKYSEFRFFFIYGGHSASSPYGVKLLRDLNAEGLIVIGEGEGKLEQIISRLLVNQHPEKKYFEIPEIGVLKVSETKENFYPKEPLASTQLKDLHNLPLPDFDEYFSVRNKAAEKNPIIRALCPKKITVEGSRGCYANCDFCAKGGTFAGFRKISGEIVYSKVLAQIQKYHAEFVTFTDNVCDPWAGKYAELIKQNNLQICSFMEHRAHFRIDHWIRLYHGGVRWIQLGVEAYSPELLRKIGKGTTVVQNLVAQKCLQELEIQSLSNLITRHPKSEIKDVIETRRILLATPHFPKLSFSPYHLNIFSPLYESIPENEKCKLKLIPEINFKGCLKGKAHQYYFELQKITQT